jgi:Zn-dependent M28 family amino/carboxypeptidase
MLQTILFTLSALLSLIGISIFFLTNPSIVRYDSTIAQKIPVQQNNLYAHVEFLTTIQPARNHANIASLQKASNYIAAAFESLTHGTTNRQTYEIQEKEGEEIKTIIKKIANKNNTTDSITEVSKPTYENVIWSYNTQKTERVIIGAHYDVCGNQKGADDNASAVAGLLELARLVNELKPNLPYRIDFVAYSLEEPPNFRTQNMGSYIHAKSLIDNKVAIKSMLCLEMIGYFSDKLQSQDYPVGAMKLLYPTVGNFIAVVGNMDSHKLTGKVKKEMQKTGQLPVYSINAPAKIPGIDFSDHQNYWKFGIPAVMITDTAFFRNQNYHTENDTIETLDFVRMTEVVRGVYQALISQ